MCMLFHFKQILDVLLRTGPGVTRALKKYHHTFCEFQSNL